MNPTARDLSLITEMIHGVLKGVIGSFLDDKIAAGDKAFELESVLTQPKFKSSARNYKGITFDGIQYLKLKRII